MKNLLNQAFPDVDLMTLDGGQVNTAAFRGQKLLVFMWASW